jgi:hypothetical protein
MIPAHILHRDVIIIPPEFPDGGKFTDGGWQTRVNGKSLIIGPDT